MKNIKCPEKCKNCEYRKIINYIRPYNFCKKLNVSFSGGEPKSFFKCEKNETKIYFYKVIELLNDIV